MSDFNWFQKLIGMEKVAKWIFKHLNEIRVRHPDPDWVDPDNPDWEWNLEECEEQLSSTKAELQTTYEDLGRVKEWLVATQTELAATQAELAATQALLDECRAAAGE